MKKNLQYTECINRNKLINIGERLLNLPLFFKSLFYLNPQFNIYMNEDRRSVSCANRMALNGVGSGCLNLGLRGPPALGAIQREI